MPPVLTTAPVRAAEPHWPDHLTIGTASPGGTYYVYRGGLAKILTRALDLPVVMRPTEGPVENIELLEKGEAKVGFVTIGIALQAWNASGVWTGKPPARSMRAMFPMYDTPFQLLVLQDSNIRALADMAGKRVGVGPRGGAAAGFDARRGPRFPLNQGCRNWWRRRRADCAAPCRARRRGGCGCIVRRL